MRNLGPIGVCAIILLGGTASAGVKGGGNAGHGHGGGAGATHQAIGHPGRFGLRSHRLARHFLPARRMSKVGAIAGQFACEIGGPPGWPIMTLLAILAAAVAALSPSTS
jgi:hypothetical protein